MAALALAIAVLIASASIAEAKPGSKPVKAAAKPAAAGAPGKPRVLRFGDLMIEGEGKSPQVYYLLNRKRIDLGHKPAEEDLISPVKDSLRDKPF